MDWATLYVSALTYTGIFSACTLAALGGHFSLRRYNKDSLGDRAKHVIIDSFLGAVCGVLFPGITLFILYSYVFDRDMIYNKL